MTKIELADAIENSDDGRVRIEAGMPGTEDHDTGYARLTTTEDRLESSHIIVDWDSGVRTTLTFPDDSVRLI